MTEKLTRLRQKLGGISEQRVLATGISHLHEELVVRRSTDIMQLPVRANGTPRVLQASFFKRLLGGQLELKSCMESDVSGAQSDLRHLSAEQLLAIRAATSDFLTDSASHSAHRNFQATVDVQLFGKLARRALRSGVPWPERPEALHKLGFHMALMLGASELLAAGWGTREGGDGRPAPAADCWLVKLDERDWPRCGFALFHASELSVEVLAGRDPDVLAASRGSCVAVLKDQSVDVGKDRTLNWDVSLLDPSVEDVLAEAALLQRSPRRPSAAERRSSSAPCAKRPGVPAAAAGAAGPPSGASRRGQLEDLPRLLGGRGGAAPAPGPGEAKPPTPIEGIEDPPLPPPTKAPGTEVQLDVPTGAEVEVHKDKADGEDPPEELQQEAMVEVPSGSTLGVQEVPVYLQGYGYPAVDDMVWQGCDLPVARLRVSEHTEADGHTHYVLDCALFACTIQGLEGGSVPVLAWQASKRLLHLRSGLHDLVKRGLGEAEYGRHFGHAPFARHMGLPGTTSRLRTWCQTLASCLSAGLLRPALVAEVLRFLGAPAPGGRPAGEDYPSLRGTVKDVAVAGTAATARRKGRMSLHEQGRARSVPYRKARSGRSSGA